MINMHRQAVQDHNQVINYVSNHFCCRNCDDSEIQIDRTIGAACCLLGIINMSSFQVGIGASMLAFTDLPPCVICIAKIFKETFCGTSSYQHIPEAEVSPNF